MAKFNRIQRVAGYLAAVDTLVLPTANDNDKFLEDPNAPQIHEEFPPHGDRPIKNEKATNWIIRILELLIAAFIILCFL